MIVDRNELLAQADELAELIVNAPEVLAYQEAEQKMKAHASASRLLQKVQDLQEQVGEFQARNVPPMHFAHLLEETESLLGQLEKIPEVRAFQQCQTTVNELLQSVTSRLARGVLNRVSEDEYPCEDC